MCFDCTILYYFQAQLHFLNTHTHTTQVLFDPYAATEHRADMLKQLGSKMLPDVPLGRLKKPSVISLSEANKATQNEGLKHPEMLKHETLKKELLKEIVRKDKESPLQNKEKDEDIISKNEEILEHLTPASQHNMESHTPSSRDKKEVLEKSHEPFHSTFTSTKLETMHDSIDQGDTLKIEEAHNMESHARSPMHQKFNSEKMITRQDVSVRSKFTKFEDGHQALLHIKDHQQDHVRAEDVPSQMHRKIMSRDSLDVPHSNVLFTTLEDPHGLIDQDIITSDLPVSQEDHKLDSHTRSSKHERKVLENSHEPSPTFTSSKLETVHDSIDQEDTFTIEAHNMDYHVPSPKTPKYVVHTLHNPHDDLITSTKLEDSHELIDEDDVTNTSSFPSHHNDHNVYHHIPSPRIPKMQSENIHKFHDVTNPTSLEDTHGLIDQDITPASPVSQDHKLHSHARSSRHQRGVLENSHEPSPTFTSTKLETVHDSIDRDTFSIEAHNKHFHTPSRKHKKSNLENLHDADRVKIRFLKFDNDAVRVEKMTHVESTNSDPHRIPYPSPTHKPLMFDTHLDVEIKSTSTVVHDVPSTLKHDTAHRVQLHDQVLPHLPRKPHKTRTPDLRLDVVETSSFFPLENSHDALRHDDEHHHDLITSSNSPSRSHARDRLVKMQEPVRDVPRFTKLPEASESLHHHSLESHDVDDIEKPSLPSKTVSGRALEVVVR